MAFLKARYCIFLICTGGSIKLPSTLKLPKVKAPKQKTPKLKLKSKPSPSVGNSLQNGPAAGAGSTQPQADTGFGFGVQWIPALSGNDPRPLVVTPASTPTANVKKPKVPRPRKTPQSLPNGPAASSEANPTVGTPKGELNVNAALK